MAKAGANPRNLIGGHSSSHTASADQDAAFRVTLQHTQGNCLGIIRIIHGLGVARADVHHLMAVLFQVLAQYLLKVKASMIGANCDSHGYFYSVGLLALEDSAIWIDSTRTGRNEKTRTD